MKRPDKICLHAKRWSGIVCALLCAAVFSAPTFLTAAEQPQWGEKFSLNMVSRERGLPDIFAAGGVLYVATNKHLYVIENPQII